MFLGFCPYDKLVKLPLRSPSRPRSWLPWATSTLRSAVPRCWSWRCAATRGPTSSGARGDTHMIWCYDVRKLFFIFEPPFCPQFLYWKSATLGDFFTHPPSSVWTSYVYTPLKVGKPLTLDNNRFKFINPDTETVALIINKVGRLTWKLELTFVSNDLTVEIRAMSVLIPKES